MSTETKRVIRIGAPIVLGGFATLLAVCAWSPALAHTGAPQAPDVKGTLIERGERVCETDLDELSGLRITTCIHDFFVDPTLDGDPDHDYSADWTQTAIDPLKGRCVAGARGWIRVHDATVIARAPSRRSRRGQNTVQLKLATPDQALGSIKQRFRLTNGVTSTEVRRSPRGDRLYWRWSGRSRVPILLVIGAGFAHPVTDDPFVHSDGVTSVKSIRC